MPKEIIWEDPETNWVYHLFTDTVSIDEYSKLSTTQRIEYFTNDVNWYIETKDDQYWFKNSNFHREDGPAIHRISTHPIFKNEYFLYGIEFTKEDFPDRLVELKESGPVAFKLKYA